MGEIQRMNNAIKQILNWREKQPLSIDGSTLNRYGVIFNENDGTHTGYFFSVPLYNTYGKNMVHQVFESKNGIYSFHGSNCDVEIGNSIVFKTDNISCSVVFEEKVLKKLKTSIANNCGKVLPTTNGLALSLECSCEQHLTFNIVTSIPFLAIRENNKMFAYMESDFKPLIVISCIGSVDNTGNIIAPALISSEKVDDKSRRIKIQPGSEKTKALLFEINYYESKLFEDTTVESLNPTCNNAFGGTAFIGTSEQFGEQWLYTRVDVSKISELHGKKIYNAVLRVPKLSKDNVQLFAYPVSTRFCSFGSNWDNKVKSSSQKLKVTSKDDCYEINITEILTNPKTKYLIQTNGLIIKPQNRTSVFSTISTGDSYYSPLSLEINYA